MRPGVSWGVLGCPGVSWGYPGVSRAEFAMGRDV